jgi:limonene-1,2-epoxide hydrolase
MKKSPMKIVQEFGQGLASGTDVWQNVIADDITFTGPVDQVKGKEAFVKLNKDFMPLVRGNEMKNVVEKDDFVITEITLDVATPTGNVIKLEMCEWYEVKNEKIQSVKVYYDAEEFRKEFTPIG